MVSIKNEKFGFINKSTKNASPQSQCYDSQHHSLDCVSGKCTYTCTLYMYVQAVITKHTWGHDCES